MSKIRSSLINNDEIDHWDVAVTVDGINEKASLKRHIEGAESNAFHSLGTEVVKTKKGDIHVAIQGKSDTKKSVLLTLHDIGQNHISAFQSFFCFHQLKPLLDNFIVYHLNFPGQHENAEAFSEDYVYPTMDEMADMVEEVVHYFNIKSSVCFGIGAGANVFTRLALKNPGIVDCLIAVNGVVNACSWSDWAYEKLMSHYLKTKGMTQFCIDYLRYHFFGRNDETYNHDLISMMVDQLNQIKNPRNLGLFIESHARRTPIKINRSTDGKPSLNSLKCGVLLITGDNSPAVDDTVDMNSKLDPTNSTWMKISSASSLVLEEQPNHVVNALILFLQGYGYVLKLRAPALSLTVMDTPVEGPLAVC